jgi:hypothetical protein
MGPFAGSLDLRRLLPLLLALLLLPLGRARADDADLRRPYESAPGFAALNAIDVCVLDGLKARGIEPSYLCSDEVFLRRVFLDVLGTLPDPEEVLAFLADKGADKRARLVDAVLARDEYADYASLRWCDVLRVKAEFPIKLWPNGVQAYHRWIRDALRANLGYDAFARALLTSSGSNFRVAPANFYRAVQGRRPADLAAAVALTFMGTRIDAWPAERRDGMAAFFSRVAYKPTREWKEEIVLFDPKPQGAVQATFPDGGRVVVPPDEDPRRVFASWLITPDNPWFARAAANRIWAWLMGRGVVHESDDFRPDNPPSNPALLDCLAKHLADSGWDLKSLYRLILTSRTYQGSPVPRSQAPEAEALFAFYPSRPLDAEVLIDALDRLDDSGEEYLSIVPEPFTFVPERQRTILLADGTISSPFLELFGRPSRDTGLESDRSTEPTSGQRLHLLNSRDVLQRIQRSGLYRRKRDGGGLMRRDPIAWAYLCLLSRPPTAEEREAVTRYAQTQKLAPRDVGIDIVWALLNSKEFLYRH